MKIRQARKILRDEGLRLAKAGILARIEAEIAELLAMCVPRKVGDMPAEPYEFEPAEPPVKPEPENASPGVFSSSAIWKYST